MALLSTSVDVRERHVASLIVTRNWLSVPVLPPQCPQNLGFTVRFHQWSFICYYIRDVIAVSSVYSSLRVAQGPRGFANLKIENLLLR